MFNKYIYEFKYLNLCLCILIKEENIVEYFVSNDTSVKNLFKIFVDFRFFL